MMSTEIETYRNVPCLGCGCLCDDLDVWVDESGEAQTSVDCAPGLAWFRDGLSRFQKSENAPDATIDGVSVSIANAIQASVERLRQSRAPLFLGLSTLSVEAVSAAVGLADQLGGAIGLAASAASAAKLRALQRFGSISATLGEIRDRADLIIYWGADPESTHPRHVERFARDPRRIIRVNDGSIVHDGKEETTFQVRPDRQAEVILCLRALTKGVTLSSERVEQATGCSLAELSKLANRITSCSHGAVFLGSMLETDPAAIEEMTRLVIELNHGRRFVCLGMGHAENQAGAEAALTWLGGAPMFLDYGIGHPRFLPGEATLDRIRRNEFDFLVHFGETQTWSDDSSLEGQIASHPSLWIGPKATLDEPRSNQRISIKSASLGVDEGGTVGRVDGVMLATRPFVRSERPNVEAILKAIQAGLEGEGASL